MKIVVFGGSGLIGSKLVDLLHHDDHHIVSASRRFGVNTITNEGLSEVLVGAEVVIDVTKPPSFDDKAVLEFFETSGHNIIAAEVKAGIKHHIALSTVGIERMQASGFFRAKMAQEKLIGESSIPFTILRSTQFFEFLLGIANKATVEQTVYLSPALFQPIAADDVVATLAKISVSLPINGIVEVAGPHRVSLAELVRRFLTKTSDPRRVEVDVNARYFGAVLNDRSLTPEANAYIGSQSFEEWFSKSGLQNDHN